MRTKERMTVHEKAKVVPIGIAKQDSFRRKGVDFLKNPEYLFFQDTKGKNVCM